MSMIVDSTTQALQNSMDLRLRRQALLGSNLANLDTPHFIPSDLQFEGMLTSILDDAGVPAVAMQTNQKHLGMSTKNLNNADNVIERADVFNTMDGNGVDLDKEMARMTENSVRFNTTIEMSRRRVGILNYTIMKMGE